MSRRMSSQQGTPHASGGGPAPSEPAAGFPPTAEELRRLTWLRKALRLNLIQDRNVCLPDLGERHGGDDVLVLERDGAVWKVSYVERGLEQAGSACRFDSVSNATHYVYWQMAGPRYPLNFQLDDCQPKPY